MTLHFDMEPRLVRANEAVEADRGRLAVERGPLVYCAEWPDNEGDVLEATVAVGDALSAEMRGDLLGGIQVIKDGDLTLIPYYAWCHRGSGHMQVWMQER